ncbi:MAG TPA: hypothetical protein VFY14_08930 [Streptomyces sp.]|nr:hypothetical protein [Streptomyces sp.]
MTAPRRPRRTRDRRPAAFPDGFPGDDRTATEVLGPYRGTVHDGAGFQWQGASDVGLPPVSPAEDYRRAIAQANAEAAAAPFDRLRVHGPQPDMFPALREPPPVPAAPVGYEVTGRETAQGWSHLGELRCDYPAALAETPIPCDGVWRDHAATTFRGLRMSAQAAGWHMDRLGQWACPRCCQASPEYRTLYAVTVYDPLAAEAYVVGDLRGENRERARAELDLRDRTVEHHHDSHEHGRHAAVAS